jgi:recombinational DNA repair ATPase RecF
MKIAKVKITNFKCYEETFTLALNGGLNVIVGANESGKTNAVARQDHQQRRRQEVTRDEFRGIQGERV